MLGSLLGRPGFDLPTLRTVAFGNRVYSAELMRDDPQVRANRLATSARSMASSCGEAGAAEIHLRVASPPLRHPCYYGIDIPNRDELIAANMTVPEIAVSIAAELVAANAGLGKMIWDARLYMLVDQKLREGIAVPFFGRDAMTTPAPAPETAPPTATTPPVTPPGASPQP